MPFKSLTKRISVGVAKHTHKCRYNKRHAVVAGAKRLKVVEGRSAQHYCSDCAKRFLEVDIIKLTSIREQL